MKTKEAENLARQKDVIIALIFDYARKMTKTPRMLGTKSSFESSSSIEPHRNSLAKGNQCWEIGCLKGF